jgi:hypothetical protein
MRHSLPLRHAAGPERAQSLPTLQATARTPTLARDAPGIPHAQELAAAVGKSLGASDWLVVDQQRIDRFADATDDHQWIHVDVARARTGPFASTIAHGYLTLSLVNALLPQLISVPRCAGAEPRLSQGALSGARAVGLADPRARRAARGRRGERAASTSWCA